MIVALAFVAVGLELAEPWPLKILVDSVFGAIPLPDFISSLDKYAALIVLCLGIVVIYSLQSIVSLVDTYLKHKFMFGLDFNLGSNYFEKLNNVALSYLDKKQIGDYAYRLNVEVGDISSMIFDGLTKMIEAALTVIGIIILLALFDLKLALIALIVVPLFYRSVSHYAPRLEDQSGAVERSTSRLYGFTTEALDNIKLTQSFNKQKRQLTFFQRILKKNFVYQLKYILTDERFSLVNDLIATCAMAVLVIFGAMDVFNHALTVGELLIFLTYTSYLYDPMQTINSGYGEIKGYFAAAKRVFEVFDKNAAVGEDASPIHMRRAKGKISFHNVTFGYGAKPIIKDVSLAVTPGEKVAILGPSGGGKSTLLSLIPRFYDATQGVVTVDNTPIEQLSLRDLRNQISIVDQDAVLLSTSIYNNIAFSNPSASRHEIEAAAKAANAYEFIMGLPNGFQTKVGERGKLLSGGEKQRIAIARAFLKDAPILLLDEPTSALDEASESSVLEAIERLMKHRTTIIVTHSRRMLDSVDELYVLKRGHLRRAAEGEEPINV